ncbi:MAG: alpha/beta fold hydrolase [Steroidobacteraceae bacterium]
MSTLTEAETSRYATVNGLRLHYNDAGRSEAVVMLHGGGPGASGWSNFYRNVDALVLAGYRVILLDQPGFNKSDAVTIDGPRDAFNAQALLGLLDCLGVASAHVVGNSLGGATAIAFAIDHPDRLKRLILIGAGAGYHSLFQPLPTEGMKLFFALYRNPTRENFQRLMEAFVFDARTLTDELLEQRYQNITSNLAHLSNFVTSTEASKGRVVQDQTFRLAEIRAETLVAWGRDDRFVPLDHALRLVTLMPNAELHVFGQCGHWGQWEQASKFNRLLLEFLGR